MELDETGHQKKFLSFLSPPILSLPNTFLFLILLYCLNPLFKILFQIIIFFYIQVILLVCLYVQTVLSPFEGWLGATMWMLGTELGSLGRAANSLNC